MIPSPCIGKCQLNRENFCIGCGRSRMEISQWTLVAQQRQAEIVAAARKRLENLRRTPVDDDGNGRRG